MVFQNVLHKGFQLKTVITRYVSTKKNLPKTIFMECLKNRTLLKISGNEVDEYLQGLITNDVKHIHEDSPCMYTMFLNSRGRVLYDSIIYKTNEPKTFLIECDLSAADTLQKHLMMYRVRRKINVGLEEELRLWVVSLNKATPVENEDKNYIKTVTELLRNSFNDCLVCSDPRISSLGFRIIAPKQLLFVDLVKKIPNFVVSTENFYKSLRYKLGVGEGTDELPPGNCFPLEANCDYLHGISFHKGCYVGQELTARTYHTGVIRKRLMPVIFSENIDCHEINVPISLTSSTEKSIGKLRGAEGNVGIGLLRVEEALMASQFMVLGRIAKTARPFWWPNENIK